MQIKKPAGGGTIKKRRQKSPVKLIVLYHKSRKKSTKTGIGILGEVCNSADFGRIGRDGGHTLVPSCIKIPRFWGKRNIPRDFRGMCHITGGDEGIRTLDTLASIPHFQCGALDQLCDVSS